jgi:hypothetical protein
MDAAPVTVFTASYYYIFCSFFFFFFYTAYMCEGIMLCTPFYYSPLKSQAFGSERLFISGGSSLHKMNICGGNRGSLVLSYL